MSALLEASSVSKRFGGIEALSDVSFSIARGQIFGLIGPNGAGKTTLFNLLTGLDTLDRGSFALDGRELAGLKADRVAERGVGRTFQNIRLFANLSALENVMIGRLRDDYELTVVLVEHHMNLVMRVSESVHVLNFGRMIAAGTPGEVQANPSVVEAYLGTGDDDAAA